ncbi:MAG: tetratricopeptide (TPR) repeat protein [Myxococcota bacterium]
MSDRPFVARESDVAALDALWQQVKAGAPKSIRLQAPYGGGRRALTAEFLRRAQANDEPFIWRVSCLAEENGLQWLIRMYGSLMAVATSDVLRRGKLEMLLNAQLPSQPKRVQGWYTQFINSMKEAKTDHEKGQVSLSLPRDNPVVGLVEVTTAIARKTPVILDLQNMFLVNSLLGGMFIETLHAEARESGAKLMLIIHDEPESDATKACYPQPLLDYYSRRADEIDVVDVAPWGEPEVAQFFASKDVTGNASRVAEIAGGRPGYVAELVEILGEKGTLDSELEGVTLASLVPLDVDEDELDIPDEPPAEGKRPHAGPDDRYRVAFFAALLGHAFPSGIVADMGGFDRESVDDLMDAMGGVFEEVQFSNELSTWIYRFKRGSYREGVIEHHANEEGEQLARNVGLFMERYLVPRGYGFMPKTSKLYAEHGALQRAALVRAMQLGNDAADVWGLAYDTSKYFDEVPWPDAMRRTVYQHLLDRLTNQGNVQGAERVHSEATEWASKAEDREFTAWLLFAGSRVDVRRQDYYRARDRAKDALRLFTGLENNLRAAEVHNHIASIELQDGNPNAALENVTKALEIGQVETGDGKKGVAPGIFATASHIRGAVARRGGKPEDLQAAIEHFRRANEVAGQANLAQVALDSGLAYGEALLAARRTEDARTALARVVEIARGVRAADRERTASELLARAHGELREFDKALPLAQRVLELTQKLRLDHLLPVDLYNLGSFTLLTGKAPEALTFFKQAEQRVGTLPKTHPVQRQLRYFMGIAQLQSGELDGGIANLEQALTLMRESGDNSRVINTLQNLSGAYQRRGDTDRAKRALEQAIGVAKSANLKDARKQLKKQLDSLG